MKLENLETLRINMINLDTKVNENLAKPTIDSKE
jgi:hypothetical protein